MGDISSPVISSSTSPNTDHWSEIDTNRKRNSELTNTIMTSPIQAPAATNVGRPHDLTNVKYEMKNISFNGEGVTVVLQTTNGACPIISLANFLSLSSGLALPNRSSISAGDLTSILADFLIARNGDLNFLSQLEGLHRGLNVNPSFKAVDSFLEGQDVIKAFGAELLHGWIPEESDAAYEMLMTTFETFETAQMKAVSDPDSQVSMFINDFFEAYPTNLTPAGMHALREHLKEGEMSILFYNAHFSLLYKNPQSGDLYTLVTDAGYRDAGDSVVWESLTLGESEYFTKDFIPQSLLPDQTAEDERLAERVQAQLYLDHALPQSIPQRRQQASHQIMPVPAREKLKKKKDCLVM